MIRINDIIDKISDYDPDANLDIIDRAYIYSARVHEGQTRLSGEPYLSHPLEVAGILAEMKLDPVSVASGILHDVIEDTYATPEEIKKLFGPEVLHIVSGVTKLGSLPIGGSRAHQAESLRQMASVQQLAGSVPWFDSAPETGELPVPERKPPVMSPELVGAHGVVDILGHSLTSHPGFQSAGHIPVLRLGA